jgi:hypothetical protein
MCCLHLQAMEIIERGHHISVYRLQVKLPSRFPLVVKSGRITLLPNKKKHATI